MIWLLAPLALGHGGAPSTSEVVFGVAGDLTLVTSHGTIAEDRGWGWICEEISGESQLPTGLTRTEGRWFLSTTSGVLASDDGCEWAEQSGPTSLTTGIARDVLEPTRVWTATSAGLWSATTDGFEAQPASAFTVRDFAQLGDGRFATLGFDDDVPVLQVGDTTTVLPVETGNMHIIAVDSQDRVYVHFPLGEQSSLARVDDQGTVELLFDRTDQIVDVAESEGSLYVLVNLLGTRWSQDDGQTWSEPVGDRLQCLEPRPDGLYGCPSPGQGLALTHTAATSGDPSSWAWTTVLRFDDVQQMGCESTSTVAGVCDALWPTVAGELGVFIEDDGMKDACGCTTSGGTGSGWLLTAMFACMRRRGRPGTAAKSHIRLG